MSRACLVVQEAGPAVTVQDLGRAGYQRYGVAEGGAVDRLAMAEGAALVGNAPSDAALELFGLGGRFTIENGPVRIALTGATMPATVDGDPVPWRSAFLLEPGQVLGIGPAIGGNYGYLHVGGGLDTPPVLGSRSTHLRARLGGVDGRALRTGDRLSIAPQNPDSLRDDRLHASTLAHPRPAVPNRIRFLWGSQAHWFSEAERARFLGMTFTVTAKLDRMGVRLKPGGDPIHSDLGLSGLSDAVCLGDIQIPGDGEPAILLADRQPTGGYPRIATILSPDLDHVVQCRPGTELRFAAVTPDEAVDILRARRTYIAGLNRLVVPLRRDPRDIPNLLDYNLISGVVSP
ncbi:MAG: biotin-dependent carboxyltransferase family protein [Pseudomonadota bacterium]